MSPNLVKHTGDLDAAANEIAEQLVAAEVGRRGHRRETVLCAGHCREARGAETSSKRANLGDRIQVDSALIDEEINGFRPARQNRRNEHGGPLLQRQ